MSKYSDVVPGWMVGVRIESEERRLERIAIDAQRRWLDEPSAEHCRMFAYALLDWARETRNRAAIDHARGLLDRTT